MTVTEFSADGSPSVITLEEPSAIFERRESAARSYCRSFDTVFTSASGSTMTDVSGRRYIDFLAGCSALNYGHNDPDMGDALVRHINNGAVSHGLDMFTNTKSAFLQSFEEIILKPRGLDYRVQFTGPTGTNAVEAALKLARKVTGRTNIVAFTNGFHGVSLGALAATGNSYHRMGPEVPLTGVSRAMFDGYLGPDFDTLDALEAMLNDSSSGLDAPAAFIVETVQGEGGLSAASRSWLERLSRLAKSAGALLIVDDIQAGIGRAGTFFSFEKMDFTPDLVVMSKSISGYGLPMALLLISPDIDVWEPAEHNGTFRGNGLAFATARVAIEKFWTTDALENDIARRGMLVRERLGQFAKWVPGSTLKGRGMFQGLDVISGDLASNICRHAFNNGLIIETSGAVGQVVKILAPLTTPDEQLTEGLDILEAAFSATTP